MRLYRLCWVVLLCSAGAWADAPGTAARVNDAEISNFRLERYFTEYLAANGRNLGAIRDPRTYRRLRQAALDDLIDKELLWQAGQEQGIKADESAVEVHFNQMRASFDNAEAFARKLELAGFDEASYRDYLRHEYVAQRMLEELSRVPVPNENDVESFIALNSLPVASTNEDRERVRRMLQARRQAEAAQTALQRLRQQSQIELMKGLP